MGGGSEETYSESEIEIGTFLGKKLYRRVWKLNKTSSSTEGPYNYDVTVTNFEPANIISMKAIFTKLNPQYYLLSDGGFANIWYDNYQNAHKFHITESLTNGANLYLKAIVVEYTKEAW